MRGEKEMNSLADFGVVGLAVMGENLALNIESRGFSVCVWNLEKDRTEEFMSTCEKNGRRISAAWSLSELCSSVARRPVRRFILMVRAGRPVDQVFAAMRDSLSPGDVVIDGGNSHFLDTERRCAEAEAAGLCFIGCGVSGGEDGALHGPSLMPGGSRGAWEHVKPVLMAIAARTEDGDACCSWMGSGGAGHFVKMVHNGIEYAEMSAISEAYHFLRESGLTNDETADAFASWDEPGDLLRGYLIKITADILRHRDAGPSGAHLVDMILDAAQQKGTGAWMVSDALACPAPARTPSPCVTVVAEAVLARSLSALKDERVAASAVLAGPKPSASSQVDHSEAVSLAHDALLADRIIAYAQGFLQLCHARETRGWTELDLASVASVWRAGCIIRSALLGDIREAYSRQPSLPCLVHDPKFSSVFRALQPRWRQFVSQCVLKGIPAPTSTSAISFHDAICSP